MIQQMSDMSDMSDTVCGNLSDSRRERNVKVLVDYTHTHLILPNRDVPTRTPCRTVRQSDIGQS